MMRTHLQLCTFDLQYAVVFVMMWSHLQLSTFDDSQPPYSILHAQGRGWGRRGGRDGRVGLSQSRSGRIVASHGCADHQSILASLRRLIDRSRQEREMAATCRAWSFFLSVGRSG